MNQSTEALRPMPGTYWVKFIIAMFLSGKGYHEGSGDQEVH